MDVTQAASSMLGMGGERPEHNRHQTFQSRMISLPGRNVVCSFSLSQLLCITRKILKWNITRLCLCVMSVLGSRTATGRLSALDYIDNRSTKIKPGLASAFGTVTPRYTKVLVHSFTNEPWKWHGMFTSQNSCRHRLCMPEQLISAKKKSRKRFAENMLCSTVIALT